MDSTPDTKDVVVAGRHEQIPVPPEVTKRLLELGGTNRYGEPLYRMVWGWSRCDDVQSFWRDWAQAPDRENPKGTLLRATLETRSIPRYDPPDRFYLEVWEPAEFWGTPESWQRDGAVVIDEALWVHPLGEFPVRGDYDFVWKCEEKHCDCLKNLECECERFFSWPTREDVEQVVFRHKKKKGRAKREARAMVKELWQKETQRREDLIAEMAKDKMRPWLFNDHVSYSGLIVPKREEISDASGK